MATGRSKHVAVLLIAAGLVASAAYAVPSQEGASAEVPADLEGLLRATKEGAQETREIEEIPEIRLNALREAALRYGVRGGLSRRSYEIRKMLEENEQLLDEIFNFNALLLDKNVLPPVLSEARHTLNQPAPDTIRVADATYRIERQAQFVTAAPNWRDYLVRNFRYEVDKPVAILLPKSEAEMKLWRKYVTEGWAVGVAQADEIFVQSLSRLERDFKGMVLYRRLLAQGMISKPYVAEANMGVTGDENAISVHDRVLRITAQPRLEPNAALWKPLAVPK